MSPEPTRLPPSADTDAAAHEHLATNRYFDEEARDFYDPAEPPLIADPAGDADSDVHE